MLQLMQQGWDYQGGRKLEQNIGNSLSKIFLLRSKIRHDRLQDFMRGRIDAGKAFQSSTQNCLIRLHGQQCEKFVRGILGIMPHLSQSLTSRLTRQRRWMGESFQKRGPGRRWQKTQRFNDSLTHKVTFIFHQLDQHGNRTFRAPVDTPQSLGSPSTKIGIFIFTGIDESIQHSFPHLAQGMDTAIPSNVYSSSVEILESFEQLRGGCSGRGPHGGQSCHCVKPDLFFPIPQSLDQCRQGILHVLPTGSHLAQIHGGITSDSGVLRAELLHTL